MKFKLDENVPSRAVDLIRQRGHDVLLVLDQVPAGTADPELAALVSREGRALVTLDLDFADIRTYEPGQFSGIVILRPRRGDANTVLPLIERVLSILDKEPLSGHLWIVEVDRIRIRSSS